MCCTTVFAKVTMFVFNFKCVLFSLIVFVLLFFVCFFLGLKRKKGTAQNAASKTQSFILLLLLVKIAQYATSNGWDDSAGKVLD